MAKQGDGKMTRLRLVHCALIAGAVLMAAGRAVAQEMPADYKAVLAALGKKGDFKDGVLKVWEQPRIFYMHVHGRGAAEELSRRLKPAVALIDKAVVAPSSSAPVVASPTGAMNTAALAKTMLEPELTPVLKALRASAIDVVAIHHHMTGVQPMVVFLHYFGTGPAERLAKGVRAAVDQLGKGAASHYEVKTILFVCEHGVGRSPIAAAYFNRLAKEKGLPYRAQFRGTDPDASLPPVVREGLKRDGFDVTALTPARVTLDDLRDAERVVVFGCLLPGRAAVEQKVIDLNGIPGPGDGYEPARDAIRQHVERLIDQLANR